MAINFNQQAPSQTKPDILVGQVFEGGKKLNGKTYIIIAHLQKHGCKNQLKALIITTNSKGDFLGFSIVTDPEYYFARRQPIATANLPDLSKIDITINFLSA